MPPKPVKTIDLDGVKVRDVPFRYGPGYDLNAPPKKKKTKHLENVMPTGIDDGKGAHKLLNSYIDEVISPNPKKSHVEINFSILSEDFRNQPFLKQVNHLQMKNIPLQSQIARQEAIYPTNSTAKRKHYMEYNQRLLKSDSHLVHARLSSEAIDDTIIKILEKGLLNNKVLQYLSLHNNIITDEGIEILCNSLKFHPTLHTIWLGANRYTDIGIRSISQLLLYNKNIIELNLSNRWPSEIWHKNEYDLHPHITYIGIQYISKILNKGYCSLTSLSLANQRIGDDGAISLFNSLKSCYLRALNLKSNQLTNKCCIELRTALETNPFLERLILSYNKISDEGAINIAYSIAQNTKLHLLDISYNNIAEKGLDGLYLCLQYNTTIKSLITIKNNYNDNRAEELVATRTGTIFNFSNTTTTNKIINRKRSDSINSISSDDSNNSKNNRKKSILKRNNSSSRFQPEILSLNVNLPSDVQIMGKSSYSKAYRQLQLDSHEVNRSSSFRSNSFRALSMKIDSTTGSTINTARSVNSEDSNNSHHTNSSCCSPPPRSPAAPMLGKNTVFRHTLWIVYYIVCIWYVYVIYIYIYEVYTVYMAYIYIYQYVSYLLCCTIHSCLYNIDIT